MTTGAAAGGGKHKRPMCQALVRELFAYDAATGWLIWNKSGKRAGVIRPDRGYVVVHLGNAPYSAHRLIWRWVHGDEPFGQLDHINGDRTDNRIENLRVVTIRENARNRGLTSKNRSGFIGVRFVEKQGRWIAEVKAPKRYYLGAYETKAEAIAARRAANIILGFHENHSRRAAFEERSPSGAYAPVEVRT